MFLVVGWWCVLFFFFPFPQLLRREYIARHVRILFDAVESPRDCGYGTELVEDAVVGLKKDPDIQRPATER